MRQARGISLQSAAPEVAGEWHPTRNGDLTPDSVAAGASRKAWWLGACGHEWQAVIHSRSRGCGCPYCGNRTVGYGNDLATRFPEVAYEWHPTRNGDLTPKQVPYGARRNVWWRCASGHEWRAMVFKRSAGSSCDRCKLTGVSEVELRAFAELHHVLNGHLSPLTRDARLPTPDRQRMRVDMILGDVAVEYDGFYWHKDKETPDREKTERLRQAGYKVIRVREHPLALTGPCDTTAPRAANAFQVATAVLQKMVDENFLPIAAARQAAEAYIAASRPLAQEEADRAVNALRAREHGPRSLAARFPLIAQQWHPHLNGSLSPTQVTAGSGRKVWWLCAAGHAWRAKVDQRVGRKTGCGFCSGRYATESTSLATLRPDLAAQWHPTLNGTLTPAHVTPHTRRVVWWLCSSSHAVEDSVANRTKGMVCQRCPNSRRGRRSQ